MSPHKRSKVMEMAGIQTWACGAIAWLQQAVMCLGICTAATLFAVLAFRTQTVRSAAARFAVMWRGASHLARLAGMALVTGFVLYAGTKTDPSSHGYVVTLNANGGMVSGQTTISFHVENGRYTSQAGANRTVSRSGYALVGWYDTSASSGGNMVFDARGYAVNGKYWNGAYSPKVSSATWKYAGNVTAYARWAKTPPYRVVTFDANGGAVGNAAYAAIVVESGKYTMQAGASGVKATRSGYTLVGWYDTNAASGGNMVFNAQGYAVNGTYWNGSYVPSKSSATWKYAGSVTAYARWAQNKSTVTLNANGGKVSGSATVSFQVEYGKYTSQAGANRTVSRSGYTLVGWFDTSASSGGNMVFNAQGYAVNGTYWNGSYVPSKSSATWKHTGNAVAYARWAQNKSTVTLNANGGTVSGTATVSFSVEYGNYTSQAGANRNVSRSGYALVGWFDTTNSVGGNMVFDARGYAVNGKYWDGAYSPKVSSAKWKYTGNMTAYARWVASPPYRVVTFDANGGAIGNAAYAAVVVESGRYTNQAGASGAQVTRAGYSLEGWFDTTNSVGGNMVFDARGYAVHGKFWNGAYSPKVSAATWRYAGNVVAYARWVKSPPYWVVTFDANGGKITDSDFASVIVESGKSTMQAAASGTSVTRTDYMEYVDIGWFDTTNSVGGNMVFDASGYAVNGKYWDGTYEPGKTSAKWKFAGNVTAYARWVRRTNNNAAASVRKSAGGSSLEDGEMVAVEAPLFFQSEFVGTFADDGGVFMLTLDDGLATAYLVTWTDDGVMACECEAEVVDCTLVLTTESGEVYHLVWIGGSLVASRAE